MRFRIKQNRDGSWSGYIMLSTHSSEGIGDVVGADSGLTIGSIGADPASAMLNSAAMADRIMSDPTIRALMPPQALMAIQSIKAASAAAKRGKAAVKSLFGRFGRHKKKKKMLATINRAQQRADEQPSPSRGMDIDPSADPEDEPAPEPETGPAVTSDLEGQILEAQAYGDIMNPDEPDEYDPREHDNVDVQFDGVTTDNSDEDEDDASE